MTDIPPDQTRGNVSPYLLKRLRSVDEAMADLRTRSHRADARRREAEAKRRERDPSAEPVDA